MKKKLLALIDRHNAVVDALSECDLPVPEGKVFRAMEIWHKLACEGYDITHMAREAGIDAKCDMQAGRITVYGDIKESAGDFIMILDHLLKLDGLEIELCGRWLWIGGNTKPHKEKLKACGCRWSNSKKLWYWHFAEDGDRWHRGNKSMNQIRRKYGSTRFDADAEEPVAAITA